MRRARWTGILALIAAPALADGGGAFVVGAPRGALGHEAGVAGGLSGHGLVSTRSGLLALRLEGSWLIYGSQTVRLPVARTAGRLDREITTDNSVAQLGLGPEIVLPFGRVCPYVHAFGGFSYLATTSQLVDPSGLGSRSSTNYDDATFSWGGGGGVLVPLQGRESALDIGVRYVRTGQVRFLTEGDLVEQDGAVRAMPRRGQANMVEFKLGLTVYSRLRR